MTVTIDCCGISKSRRFYDKATKVVNERKINEPKLSTATLEEMWLKHVAKNSYLSQIAKQVDKGVNDSQKKTFIGWREDFIKKNQRYEEKTIKESIPVIARIVSDAADLDIDPARMYKNMREYATGENPKSNLLKATSADSAVTTTNFHGMQYPISVLTFSLFILKLLARTPIDEEYHFYRKSRRADAADDDYVKVHHKPDDDSILYKWSFTFTKKKDTKTTSSTINTGIGNGSGEMMEVNIDASSRLPVSSLIEEIGGIGKVLEMNKEASEDLILRIADFIILKTKIDFSDDAEYIMSVANHSYYFETLEYGGYRTDTKAKEISGETKRHHGTIRHKSVQAPIGFVRATMMEFMAVSSRGKDIFERYLAFNRIQEDIHNKREYVNTDNEMYLYKLNTLRKSTSHASEKYKDTMGDLEDLIGDILR